MNDTIRKAGGFLSPDLEIDDEGFLVDFSGLQQINLGPEFREFQPEVQFTGQHSFDGPVSFKYNEGLLLQQVIDYIAGTYSQHYSGKGGLQAIDVWESRGSLESTACDTAIKYLIRYGKKDGRNRKDLWKAIHYITLMLYIADKEQLP